MKDNFKNSIHIFNKYAASYQEKYMDVGLYKNSLQLLLNNLSEDAKVLDLACGPGNISAYLHQHKPKLQILGIDGAENMVNLARKNIPQGEFKVMDIREIDKIERDFDAVICSFCLPYLPEKEARELIQKAATILSQTGVIYLSTMEGDYSLSRYQKSSSGDDEGLFIYFYPSSQLKSFLKDAGFTVLSEEIITQPEEQKSSGQDIILIGTL